MTQQVTGSQVSGQAPIHETELESLRLFHRGKVRDTHEIPGGKYLLQVMSNRLSGFDVVLPTLIPGKGRVLTELSHFWFDKFRDVVLNHTTGIDPYDIVTDPRDRKQIEGRSMVVKRLWPLKAEAVVRGYLIGSGWKDYCDTGAVCGIKLPAGLQMASKLDEPIFTPAAKAPPGEHDPNISFDKMMAIPGIGLRHAERIKNISLELYKKGADYALGRGIIIADTKFEFGVDEDDRLYWIDEALTPDSSRFWPVSSYRVGVSPPSLDKQIVRDWLETQGWNKKPPAPALLEEVIRRTTEAYEEALRILTA